MTKIIDKIVKTIISLNTRKFGDVGETIITKIIKDLQT